MPCPQPAAVAGVALDLLALCQASEQQRFEQQLHKDKKKY